MTDVIGEPGVDAQGRPGDRRSGVLRVLKQASAPMSIVQVAERLGVHANTVRFHLETLARQGRVEQVATDRRRTAVGLRNCLFLELTQARAQAVRPIHLGLMQGALDARAAPTTVDRLEAFAEPDPCLAHLAPADPGR